MAKYREVYITIEEFVILQETDRLYEGFVIGLGYAFVDTDAIPPPNLRGYTYVRDVPPAMNLFTLVRFQFVDNSPEMVEMSKKGTMQKAEYHTVRQGDTLSALASKYGVKVSDIVKWNNIADPNKIEVGQTLAVNKYQEALDVVNHGINIAGTVASAIASFRYTSYPWGKGYFRSANGKLYSLSVLEVQPNGKYVRGVQGLRNAANTAKNISKIPRLTGQTLGWVTLGYDVYKFRQQPNVINGLDLAIGGVSLYQWQVGALYFGLNGMVWAASGEIETIRDNIINNKNNHVYNPTLGF
ncbi:MAG: LysM peptidoglycan-binding domain-containing protein [Prevotellaceae bacterium]|jgi:LysM repeat protein|nr:LysM peptidoglycan-binding domain-containing protein [Prevotellaceae bacterium]